MLSLLPDVEALKREQPFYYVNAENGKKLMCMKCLLLILARHILVPQISLGFNCYMLVDAFRRDMVGFMFSSIIISLL
jgi:hypothetical protein